MWLHPQKPICTNCLKEADERAKAGNPKLPFRLTADNFADVGETWPETDALTFFEEELLSPIQHIVRIFTLHATGQCELRGHVGNLFQNGPQYVRQIPAVVGDMKMLLIRRCPKDPNRKQRVPFLVSRVRLEKALDRLCRPASEGGCLALQPGALTLEGYAELVCRENLNQFSASENGEEPAGLQVAVVEQKPWDLLEYKLFAMWVSARLELQLAARVRLMHEPGEVADDAARVEQTWASLRAAIGEETQECVGSVQEMHMVALAEYLTMKSSGLGRPEIENILHDELTAVQELATWEQPLTEEGFWSPEDLAGQQSEDAMKDDLWQAVCQANMQDGSDVSLRRFGAARVSGLPILDPPTVRSRNQLIREDQPYYIAAGFVKLFPSGTGDFWAHESWRRREGSEISFWEWIRHVLQRSDGRFQAHPGFYFFALNTALRNKALRGRSYFLKRQVGINTNVKHTNEDLLAMGKANFVRLVSAFEHSLAGSAQEKIHQRSDLEAMVEQIEQGSLEDQAQELLKCWQAGIALLKQFSEQPAAGTDVSLLELGCAQAESILFQVLGRDNVLAGATCASAGHVVAGRESGANEENTEGLLGDTTARMDEEGTEDLLRDHDDAATAGAGAAVVESSSSPTLASAGSVAHAADRLHELEEELVSRVDRLAAGGEIPCHFTTLTTAIYHWQDLGACLNKYEEAVLRCRQGRRDPLEPSERDLDPHRRRVLRYPGVVAWFTAYKIELFYKYVLQYEDGQGIFEWGAGGIMHLHSINFGSQMPRIDPAAKDMEFPNEQSARTAQIFASVHEEYLSDWNLGKAEKWSFQEVENGPARKARGSSPVHTDSESEGSEDLDAVGCASVRTTGPKMVSLKVGLENDALSQQDLLQTWISFAFLWMVCLCRTSSMPMVPASGSSFLPSSVKPWMNSLHRAAMTAGTLVKLLVPKNSF
eukprot:s1595_g14.t3